MDLKDKLETLPADPGVYIMKDKKGAILYIGKAKSLRSRVRSYWRDQDSSKTKQLVAKIADIEIIATPTELDALILENNLIKEHQPFYNLRLKDDKRYPYLKLTVNEKYPRLSIVRRYEDDGARYFGPFSGRNIILYALRELRTVFKLRSCSYPVHKLPKKTCLQFQIKRCLGPCEHQEVYEEYKKSCRNLILFLEGKRDALIKALEEEMRAASQAQQYEKAALTRDRLNKITALFQRQEMVLPGNFDQDFILFFEHNGEQGLDVLQVREGKVLANEVVFFAGDQRSLATENIHQRQLLEYYERKAAFPAKIVLAEPLPEFPLLKEWFRKEKQQKVELVCEPKHELLAMVRRNIELIRIKDIKDTTQDEALAELQEALGIDFLPMYIEAYDVSNTGGNNIIGSKVVFKEGRPWKTAYRRYNIRTVKDDPNDYASLEEMLTRRCAKLAVSGLRRAQSNRQRSAVSGKNQKENITLYEVDDPTLPRLFLIDGGKGQLGIAEKVLRAARLKIPVISIAKEQEDIYYRGHLVALAKDSAAQKLLQRLRDEAHRFGITLHRKKRTRTSFASELENISGLGPQTRKKLLRAFDTINAVRSASQKYLAEVLGAKLAEKVYNYFHGGKTA
jgi:excinuclease ABC subunit C